MPSLLIAAVFILRWTVRILIVIFLADLLVGFVHWLEDSYGQVDWPLIGKSVIEPNLLHHDQPRAFLVNSWWQSADLQIVLSVILVAVCSLIGWLSWELVAVLALAANGNEVHKWAHRTREENGRLITWLQDHHVIQSRRHHGAHHGGDRNSHYCTLTPWVNPVLERLRFWRGLEALVRAVTGASPRIDPAVLRRRAKAQAG